MADLSPKLSAMVLRYDNRESSKLDGTRGKAAATYIVPSHAKLVARYILVLFFVFNISIYITLEYRI